MIPTLILAGAVVGVLPRQWFVAGMALAAVGWPALLVGSGTIKPGDVESVIGALMLAAVNAAAGAIVTRTLGRSVRAARER